MELVLAGLGAASRAHRERLDPAEDVARRRAAVMPPDPASVLLRSASSPSWPWACAYLAGDRGSRPGDVALAVHLRRLAADALAALRAEDLASAEEAMALVIDLACDAEVRLPRSEDPMEAAKFVVSDAAAALWNRARAARLRRFAATAAVELPRWESAYGGPAVARARAGRQTLSALPPSPGAKSPHGRSGTARGHAPWPAPAQRH